MKKPLIILMIAVLIILAFHACSSTIRTANTSLVTITIGTDARSASLHAERATPWARFKYYLAETKLMPEAYAYIPSVVQVLVVHVTAADMATPIVGIASISANQTTATLRIEVPNGAGRKFTVEGIRGVDSKTYYRGTATADLTGLDVNLPVSMNFVGTGIYVDPSLDPAVADQPSCGTLASPCATITYVLNTRPSTTSNDVILALPGTYKVGSVAAQETFPLALKPGMALICLGPAFSSVIDTSSQTFVLAVQGNDNASIDNCLIRVGSQGTGVSDMANPQLLITAATKINRSAFEVPAGATAPTNGVVFANDKSLLIESSLTGTGSVSLAIGLQVNGGKPTIIGSTISNLPIGIDLASGAGDATISNNLISGNSTAGINIAGNAKPVISGNLIEKNFAGILVPFGSPRITGNTIRSNSLVGVDISSGGTGTATGSPRVNGNSLSCNGIDANVVSDAVIDLRNNGWDHDPGTLPPGPLLSQQYLTYPGYDIVYSLVTPTPNYVPFSPAVPGGCLPIGLGKPGR